MNSAYDSSGDDLFFEGTTILDELDDSDELGAMSTNRNLAPDANVEAANIDSFYDDDVAIPKGKSYHYMLSMLVYVSFDLGTGGEYCGIII